MLGAGQDLDRALRFLVDTAANARIRRVASTLRDAVRDGSPLAAALAAQPRSFSRLTIGLVRAGEAGGTLAPTLERLATLMERERSLAATVHSAMIYPAMLLAAAVGAIALLLTQVLPQFVPLFEQNGAQLPASTQFLIAAGDVVSRLTASAALLAVVSAAGGGPAWRCAGRGRAWPSTGCCLRVPLFGGLAREVMAARLSPHSGTLLHERGGAHSGAGDCARGAWQPGRGARARSGGGRAPAAAPVWLRRWSRPGCFRSA